MKLKSPLLSRFHCLIVVLVAMVVFTAFPAGKMLADANVPTETPTSEPQPTATITLTASPQPQIEATAFPTNVQVIATDALDSALFATPGPPPTSVTGGLSLLNRLLLVLLAIVTVVVMGVIVYAIYYRTRREGLEDR
jgi:hypothetical protein